MVKVFQCHSNHLPQLFNLKKQEEKQTGISEELLHRFEPNPIGHAYYCSCKKSV